MKGDTKSIEYLNGVLRNELTAMDQYFIHSRMYEDWGLNELYERLHHEMQEESEHATKLIQRILFLEGAPNLKERDPLNVGTDVPGMLKNDLELEYRVIATLKEVIAQCEAAKDFETREILEDLLQDTEEDHTWWLEQQLGLINKIGLNNYLQSKM
ncbi:MAG: bacterioferritin [Pseudomonadota bacterium]